MKVLIASILLALSHFTYAQSMNVQEVINNYQDSIEQNYVETITYRSWTLSTIRIRTTLELGIEIPLISKFKLNPEIELYFSR